MVESRDEKHPNYWQTSAYIYPQALQCTNPTQKVEGKAEYMDVYVTKNI